MKSKKKDNKKFRNRLLFVAFIILNILVISLTASSEFKEGGNASSLQDVQLRWWLLIPAALLFLIALYSEIYKYYMVMRASHSEPSEPSERPKSPESSKPALSPSKSPLPRYALLSRHHLIKSPRAWLTCVRTVILGRYYDNITPAAVGGQPFQIYYMHKEGVKKGFDAVIPLVGMISDQLGFLIIGVISIVFGSLCGCIWSPAIIAVGWIGLLCFAFFPIVILAATFLPKTTSEILGILVRFLAKLHIIKNKKAALAKAEASIHEYSSAMRTALSIPHLFLKTLILGLIYYTALSLIPYFVLTAFGAEINIFSCFATTVAVSAAIYFVPTPGNSGAAEGTFYTIFSVLPSSGYVFWAMLVWRFFVYYLWLIIGLIEQLALYLESRKANATTSKSTAS